MSAARQATASRRNSLKQVPWLLAVPGVVALFAFHFVPIAFGGYYAFTDWNGLTPRARGSGSRTSARSSPTGRRAEPLAHARARRLLRRRRERDRLALALALNRAVKTRHLLRALFFAPVVISPLAISFIWLCIFDYQGALNRVLAGVGLESWQRSWLGDPPTALWTILVVMVWQFSGLAMVIYLAGLQGISDDVYEATLVDGASGWLRLRRSSCRCSRPRSTVSVTFTLIVGLRVFDQVLALTDGGPVDASETLATQIYKQTFSWAGSATARRSP